MPKPGFPARSPALRRSLAREDKCPECGGELDTGWECNDCGYDAMDEAYPPTALPAEIPPEAWWRLAGHFVLNRLQDEALRQACETLVDLYGWQVDRATLLASSQPEGIVVKERPDVTYIDRQPFEIEA